MDERALKQYTSSLLVIYMGAVHNVVVGLHDIFKQN